MKYFAVQVRTLKEDSYIAQLNEYLRFRHDKQEFMFPKRKLSVRRMGKTSDEIRPVFPGYIFVAADEIDPELFNIMRGTKNFTRFLKNNKEITPITGRDLTVLQHFLHFGGLADTSLVTFDENDRIIVKSGPMQGLEGLIVKVDKRKKRAKISLDFANENFLIDLAFDVLEEHSREV
ncbi:antiterminator LoaP [Treponema sp. OMZ 840]|uniref:antiterminator LoaP n=1 Tax=Treponema sp. OMZ 840 TaxID=244313 RepID=UPI003D901911